MVEAFPVLKGKQVLMKMVAYLRVSTDEQAQSGAGLKGQEDACRRHAEREGVYLVGPFADEGVSGAAGLDKRPGLLDALSALDAGGVLLVAKRDRLGRDPLLIVALIEAAVSRKGCRVVSAAGEGTAPDGPTDVLMRRMVDAFAEYERLVIKSRTKSALTAKARRRERVGTIPYGCRLAKDGIHLEPHEAEQAALAVVYQLADAGKTPRQIARELDARLIPTKRGGPRWAESSVRKLVGAYRTVGIPRTEVWAMSPASRPALSDQLRAIIQARGTAYSVAKDSGLDPGVVARFLSHERGLTVASLDKLAESLGLRLIETGRPARRPAKGGGPARRAAARPPVAHEPLEPLADD